MSPQLNFWSQNHSVESKMESNQLFKEFGKNPKLLLLEWPR